MTRDRIRWIAPLLAAATTLAAATVLIALRGIIFSPDSGAYDDASTALLAVGLDYAAWLQGDLGLHYAGFVTALALLKIAFGTGWSTALIVLNLIALATAALAVSRTIAGLQVPSPFVLLSVIAVAGLYDVVQWAPYALSDPVFIAAVTVCACIAGTSGSWRGQHLAAFAAAAVVGVAWRPTGVVLLGYLLVLPLVLPRLSSPSPRVRRMTLGAMILLSVVAFAIFAAVMQDITLLPDQARPFMESMVKHYYDAGEVVYDRPATYHSPPSGYLDYLLLVFDRWLHFFWVTAEGHSVAHVVYGLAVRAPIMVLAALAVTRLASARPIERDDAHLIASVLCLVWVFSSAHGMLQVDYDWRYRAPVMPSMACLALLMLGRCLWRRQAL
ncbi:hypothetical protein [Anianabacter salinae]|uniref:hypothetical protein n=1 Tax=Anianabacter salinae TaxID=2851023 RepID=UPI00225E3C6B|nr:hypothetical protein [Anianabacter salinae]MBV0913455.1 hypothetical protein [Anianabacter salinae]